MSSRQKGFTNGAEIQPRAKCINAYTYIFNLFGELTILKALGT